MIQGYEIVSQVLLCSQKYEISNSFYIYCPNTMFHFFIKCTRAERFTITSKYYSTRVSQMGVNESKKQTVRSLFRQPIFKSIFLTIVFGSAVVDFMRTRKEYEAMNQIYETKFTLLKDIINDLKSGRKLDISKELNIANTLTKYKYNTVTDVEFDESLNAFLASSGANDSDDFHSVGDRDLRYDNERSDNEQKFL
ncbi:uncharacterized protein PRCAT00001171001 [Priceomyces carsonii]|uniref:uncharacterized protein n=1 Tax=Priceomyces carsonii TaxID=28549 RepID=UPI002ED88F4C|nr:unnamed protein product [Priceomyces carsonii]